MKRKVVFWTVIGLLLWVLPALGGEDDAAKDQMMAVDDMVVTATRTKERAIDVPVRTEVITREKIEMSGAMDIGDLIGKYITGHYHKYNGLLSPMGLRGVRTDGHGEDIKGSVLILIDGHRIGTGNAAKISLDRIERVEVTKGAASALYGSAALGGVINLITKRGDGELSATISAEYGSFNYYKGQIAGGGEVNDKLRFHLTASYDDVDDYSTTDFGTVYNSGTTKLNIGGNLVYTFNDRHELRLGGNFADLTSESPSWMDGDYYSTYDPDNENHNDKSHRYMDLEYNGDLFDGQLHWRGVAYYLWDLNHWNYGYTYGVAPEDYQSKYTDTTLGTDHQFVWNMASWNKLLFGFTLEQMNKKSEGVSAGEPSTPYTPGLEYNNQALFLQDSLDLADDRINIIAAARYDRFEVNTEKPETGGWAEDNSQSVSYDHICPKVGIGYKFLEEKMRVRGNVGEGFKSPSADQLSADYVHHNGTHYLGNADLKPETSLSYELGYDLMLPAFTLNLTYFHADYEDKIASIMYDDNGTNTQTYINVGDAEMAGFDIGLEWHIGRMLDWEADLSLSSNATFNTTKKDKDTGLDMTYVSDYEVKSDISAGYRGFTTQLSYVLVGPQFIYSYITYQNEDKDSFDFWDLTMRYRFLEHWEVKAGILNLLDQRVEWAEGYPMAERNYRVGVAYTF